MKQPCCCCSVAQWCPSLFDPIDCSSQPSLSPSSPEVCPFASVMPPSYIVLWHPLFLPPSIFPSITDFSSELTVCIRWPKYWSFSFSISPSKAYSGLISLKIDWFDFLAVQGTFRIFSSTTVLRHQFFGILPSLWSNSHDHTWLGRLQPSLHGPLLAE